MIESVAKLLTVGLLDPSFCDILRKVLDRALGRGGVKLPPFDPENP